MLQFYVLCISELFFYVGKNLICMLVRVSFLYCCVCILYISELFFFYVKSVLYICESLFCI